MERVELLPAGEDLEMVRGAPVVRGVQIEGDVIAVDRAIAAAEERGRRERVVALDADVDGVVVPEDAEAGFDRGRSAFVGRELPEPAPQLRLEPGRLVGAAVEVDGTLAADGVDRPEILRGVFAARRGRKR